jgi:hypothetical protein
MAEFVSFAGPSGQDLETRKRVRSQAMRDYRKRQRESKIAEPEQGKSLALHWDICTPEAWQSRGAYQQQQTNQSHDQKSTSKRLALRESPKVIPYSMSSLPRIDTVEQYDLHYFHSVVMSDIAGLVYVGFWDDFLPRLCQSENVVRQAVVALSRTHADLAYNGKLRHPPTLRDKLSSSQSSASSLKASKALRRYIEESNSPSYELVLTCNIIFHALELLQGAEENALCHLKNGIAMFKAWKRQRQRSSTGSDDGFDEIRTVLGRLDLSATIADDDRIPIFEFEKDKTLSPSITGTRLTSARDAHYRLMKIATPAWAFFIRNKCWRDVPIDLVPGKVVEEQRLFLLQYRAWTVAADQLEWETSLRRRDESLSADKWERDQRVAKVSLLATWIHHWCSKRMMEEALQDPECTRPFDRNPHEVLRYARSIIEYTDAAEDGTEMCRRMSFSPEIGICSILFLLAHRTTDPSLRTEALQLARYFNRLEGARDLISAFERWTLLPEPKPGFPYMLGEPGF